MIRALLFDLDDTLLGNDMGTFIPAYFQRVVAHFAEVDPQVLLGNLLAGTQAMLTSTDPTRTLRAVFSERFALPANGDTWARFDRFYQTAFPTLQALTTPRPEARPTLEWAFRAGYRVVVATNALFPLAAIQERLRWAGLADLPFEFITHIENSHFAKPNPEYFAEIVTRLGLRTTEALMVGNDWNDDLAPSAALGLPHWWVAPPGTPAPDGRAAPVGIGGLGEFQRWAEAHLPSYEPPPPPVTRLPYRLAGNLAWLCGELNGRTAAQWLERPENGEWSLTEIACHLRDVDLEVNLPRVQAVLETDNPFIAGAVTDPWAVERDYQAQNGPRALRDFAAARQALVGRLRALTPESWARGGRHAILGPSTLGEIMSWAMDHDRLHLEQVRAALMRLG